MTLSPFDLWVAIIVVVMMPLIIWVNYSKREGGLQGYLWRESPTLVWTSLVFLSLVFASAAARLLSHYGFLSLEADDILSMALGIPLFVLSMAIIVMGSLAFVKYMRSSRGA